MQRPTPAILKKMLSEYLEECRGSGSPPLASSFAIYVGTDQETLRGWTEDARYAPILRRLEDAAEDSAARTLLGGRNAAGVIFYLKSKHGWTDKPGAARASRRLHAPQMTEEEWARMERRVVEARRARLGEGTEAMAAPEAKDGREG